MPFGQQSGPPASVRQVRELLGLIQGLGHSDFRDARGPMGFTQRQAAGRFTSDEAAALIDQLNEAEAETGRQENQTGTDLRDTGTTPGVTLGDAGPPAAEPSEFDRALRRAPAEKLVAELQRRGWTVSGPRGRRPPT
jgi:hypothetical protein